MRFSSTALSSVASYTKMSETPVSLSKEITTTTISNTKRFEGDGLMYKGKLIGMEELSIDRDEKICLDSMFKLKAVVRARGEHKQKIQIILTMTAVRIIDETTKVQVASHEIERISFVVTDPRDTRAFGYIFNTPEDRHQFWAFKTDRAAAATVLSLKDLFGLVFEQFTNAEKAKLEENKSTTTPVSSLPVLPSNQLVSTQESSPNILDTSLPPSSVPVVPIATSSVINGNVWGENSTTTITQTTVPRETNLLDIDAFDDPVIQPTPKIIDPLDDLFDGLSTITTQPAASTNTTNPLFGWSPNAAPSPTNPYTHFSPPATDMNPFSTLPQQQQPYISRTAPPPPSQQPRQQDFLAPRSFSPVPPPSVTNPFTGLDILADLTSGTTATKPTKESFFPTGPPPKTLEQLKTEKQS